jgi:hypothetical protein
MRLLAIGVVLVALVLAMAVLFHKVSQLEEDIEQAKRPRLERIASVTPAIPQVLAQQVP